MHLTFILVSPAVEGNIGAAARAIKTMGFMQLRLVNPCDHLSATTRMLAHGAQEILEAAVVYPDLRTSLADLDFSIATTAKSKDARLDYQPADQLADLLRGKGGSVGRVGLVFGGEESGLSNEEIRQCDLASNIPMAQAYPSLNLAQAVMVYAYALRDLAGNEADSSATRPDQEQVPLHEPGSAGAPQRIMMERAREILQALALDRNPAIYHRIQERLAQLGEDDIHLMLSVLGRLKSHGI